MSNLEQFDWEKPDAIVHVTANPPPCSEHKFSELSPSKAYIDDDLVEVIQRICRDCGLTKIWVTGRHNC